MSMLESFTGSVFMELRTIDPFALLMAYEIASGLISIPNMRAEGKFLSRVSLIPPVPQPASRIVTRPEIRSINSATTSCRSPKYHQW